MAVRKPLVVIGGTVQELPAADSLPGGGGPAAWADITGRPGLVGADGWAFMATPGRWSSVSGIGAPLEVQAGTADHPIISNAGLRASMPRWSLTGNGAVDGGVAQAIGYRAAMVSASGSATGGFTYRCRFSITSTQANQRGFIGLLSYVGDSASIEPYNGPDNIGIAFNAATDANYQIVSHPAYGSLTKVDAGAGFPVGNPSAVLEVTIKNAPGSGSVNWRLRDLNSGAAASGTVSTNLPPPTAGLMHKNFMNNAGSTGVVSMELMSVYIGNYIPD